MSYKKLEDRVLTGRKYETSKAQFVTVQSIPLTRVFNT